MISLMSWNEQDIVSLCEDTSRASCQVAKQYNN